MNLKAKLDENMPRDPAEFLKNRQADVHTVAQEGLSGSDDARLLDFAHREGRVLLTYDTDFADIRRYPPSTHAGVVVFRLKDQRWAALEPHVKFIAESGHLETLTGCLAIVDEDRVRFRR